MVKLMLIAFSSLLKRRWMVWLLPAAIVGRSEIPSVRPLTQSVTEEAVPLEKWSVQFTLIVTVVVEVEVLADCPMAMNRLAEISTAAMTIAVAIMR